jgi:hypothetical protein
MGAEWLSNPDERIHVARDLRRAGKSLDEIVLETGLSRWNVSKACADIVSVWKREHPMRAEIERLLAEGRTARDVAGALSVDDKTVAKVRDGKPVQYPRRPHVGGEIVSKAAGPVVAAPTDFDRWQAERGTHKARLVPVRVVRKGYAAFCDVEPVDPAFDAADRAALWGGRYPSSPSRCGDFSFSSSPLASVIVTGHGGMSWS